MACLCGSTVCSRSEIHRIVEITCARQCRKSVMIKQTASRESRDTAAYNPMMKESQCFASYRRFDKRMTTAEQTTLHYRGRVIVIRCNTYSTIGVLPLHQRKAFSSGSPFPRRPDTLKRHCWNTVIVTLELSGVAKENNDAKIDPLFMIPALEGIT